MARWDRFYPIVRARLIEALGAAESPAKRVRYAHTLLVLERTNLARTPSEPQPHAEQPPQQERDRVRR